MLNKTLIKEISKISNSTDMNELIRLVKAQRSIVQSTEAVQARATFSKGDKVKFTSSKTGVTKTGILTKVKIKRALVMVKGEGNWDVPLSMLEVA